MSLTTLITTVVPTLSEGASESAVNPGALGIAVFGLLVDFPLDRVRIRSKTGSAEVYGKQSTSWVASYDERYVVVMMVSQGGTGSGTSGPAIRKIWETLYGVKGMKVDPRAAALPGAKPPARLPVFAEDGAILPPMARGAERSRDPRKARR